MCIVFPFGGWGRGVELQEFEYLLNPSNKCRHGIDFTLMFDSSKCAENKNSESRSTIFRMGPRRKPSTHLICLLLPNTNARI